MFIMYECDLYVVHKVWLILCLLCISHVMASGQSVEWMRSVPWRLNVRSCRWSSSWSCAWWWLTRLSCAHSWRCWRDIPDWNTQHQSERCAAHLSWPSESCTYLYMSMRTNTTSGGTRLLFFIAKTSSGVPHRTKTAQTHTESHIALVWKQ